MFLVSHSYLIASIGERFAAFLAGNTPNTTPTSENSNGGNTGTGGGNTSDTNACGADGSGNLCLAASECSGDNVMQGKSGCGSEVCCKSFTGTGGDPEVPRGDDPDPAEKTECERRPNTTCRKGPGCETDEIIYDLGGAPLKCNAENPICCVKKSPAPEKTECEKVEGNVCHNGPDCRTTFVPAGNLSCGGTSSNRKTCCKKDSSTQAPPQKPKTRTSCNEYAATNQATLEKCNAALGVLVNKEYIECVQFANNEIKLCYKDDRLCRNITDHVDETCLENQDAILDKGIICLEEGGLFDDIRKCCPKNHRKKTNVLRGQYSCVDKTTDGFAPETADLDLNGDGVINTIDALLLTDFYGEEIAAGSFTAQNSTQSTAQNAADGSNGGTSLVTSPDINGDGVVNSLDLSYLLASFGTSTTN